MQMIAAVDQDWGLGKDGELLFSIPEDLARFKALTMGGTLIMGRKTLESLPGGKPLPGRVNVILSRKMESAPGGAVVCGSLSELEALLPDLPEPVSVIGGGEIYALLLGRCHRLHLTKIHARREADTFFPNVDELTQWELAAREECAGSPDFTFCTYERTDAL